MIFFYILKSRHKNTITAMLHDAPRHLKFYSFIKQLLIYVIVNVKPTRFEFVRNFHPRK